jgi:lipopolysaccharide transport system permease protein
MIQIWMFASPVAYPLEVIPESWKLAYSLNPMTGMISGFRSALLGQSIRWDCLAVSFAVAIAMFVVGAFIFRRVERRFADIV